MATSLAAVLIAGCQVSDPSTSDLPTLGIFSPASATRTYPYGPDRSHRIDLYVPSGWTPGARRPTMVFLHGGSWVAGDQTYVDPIIKSQLRRGWVVLSATYRKSYQASWPAQARDIDRMMRWVRSRSYELGVDTDTVVLAGHSAGGHLALMNGLASGRFIDPSLPINLRRQSPRPDAVVAIAAPTNLGRLGFVLYDTSSTQLVNQLLACPPVPPGIMPMVTCTAKEVRAASPNFQVSADDPPVYIIHGDLDRLVDPQQARSLHRRLRAVGRGDQTWLDMVDNYVVNGRTQRLPDRDRGHDPSYKVNLPALEFFLDSVRSRALR
jgi:acetyl esterase/lipase